MSEKILTYEMEEIRHLKQIQLLLFFFFHGFKKKVQLNEQIKCFKR